MKKHALTLLLAASTITANAQTGVTKLDINVGFGSSYPIHITPFGNGVACYGNNGSKGWELFTTNGYTQPAMAGDINPLAGSAINQNFNHPIAAIGSKVYFTAENGASGFELFSYNGSTTPTITQEIEFGTGSSSPDDFTVMNGKLYFRASSTGFGYELWQYDPGTNTPTRLTDINPNDDSSVTGNIIAFNNNIYFTADTGNNNELYIYNPLLGAAAMVAEINPGGSSNPMHMTVIGNKLYFSADDGSHGRELFEYGGIGVPVRVTDLAAATFDGMPDTKAPIIVGYNNKVYFTGSNTVADKQVYVYDPATGNTVQAASTNGTNSSEPSWYTLYDGKIYFTSYCDTTGFEIWSYNGSGSPTLLFNFCAGNTNSNPQQLTAIGDNLYFRAVDCGGIGDELFRYNLKEVSVSNVKFEGKASLFPNPTSGTATLQLQLARTEPLLINITDIQGRTVYTAGIHTYNSGTNSITLPTATLGAGTYLCNVYSSAGSRYISTQLIVK